MRFSRKIMFLVQLLVAGLFLVLFLILGIQFDKKQSAIVWTGTNIEISDSSKYEFVTRSEVLAAVNGFRYEKNKTKISDIKVNEIRKRLSSNKYIDQVYVYVSNEGKINVSIVQQVPVMRFQGNDGNAYVFTEKAEVLLLKGKLRENLPVITFEGGTLNLEKYYKNTDKKEVENRDIINNLIKFANYVESDSFLSNLIVQINVNNVGDIELIPRLGCSLIVFCGISDIENYAVYADKLKRFYEGLSDQDLLNRYRYINLKYSNQVVVTKKGKQ